MENTQSRTRDEKLQEIRKRCIAANPALESYAKEMEAIRQAVESLEVKQLPIKLKTDLSKVLHNHTSIHFADVCQAIKYANFDGSIHIGDVISDLIMSLEHGWRLRHNTVEDQKDATLDFVLSVLPE